jgi:hypothetical protein
MSVFTLKKKTQTKYNNMSVGNKDGFSLNGTHRNQGFVGQTNLSRSLPRTLAKGNTLKGNGGCCGHFPIFHPIVSTVTSTEDPNVIKPSVINTRGMISTHYRWIHRPKPFSNVKSDNNLNNNTQQDYINNLKRHTIEDIHKCTKTDKVITNCNTSCSFNKKTNFNYQKPTYTMTKPKTSYVVESYGEYLNKLDNKCVVQNSLPTHNSGIPFACGIIPI